MNPIYIVPHEPSDSMTDVILDVLDSSWLSNHYEAYNEDVDVCNFYVGHIVVPALTIEINILEEETREADKVVTAMLHKSKDWAAKHLIHWAYDYHGHCSNNKYIMSYYIYTYELYAWDWDSPTGGYIQIARQLKQTT